MIIYYSTDDDTDHREPVDLPANYTIGREREAASIAEICAEHEHDNCDGWESSWPKIISLYETETSDAIGKYKVEREYAPEFIAIKQQ